MHDAFEMELAPRPTIEAMWELGETRIAELLGTYQFLLSKRGRLFNDLLQAGVRDPETWPETARALFQAWQATERRLGLYALLANELDPLP